MLPYYIKAVNNYCTAIDTDDTGGFPGIIENYCLHFSIKDYYLYNIKIYNFTNI